jgi:hypothetical protein
VAAPAKIYLPQARSVRIAPFPSSIWGIKAPVCIQVNTTLLGRLDAMGSLLRRLPSDDDDPRVRIFIPSGARAIVIRFPSK